MRTRLNKFMMQMSTKPWFSSTLRLVPDFFFEQKFTQFLTLLFKKFLLSELTIPSRATNFRTSHRCHQCNNNLTTFRLYERYRFVRMPELQRQGHRNTTTANLRTSNVKMSSQSEMSTKTRKNVGNFG